MGMVAFVYKDKSLLPVHNVYCATVKQWKQIRKGYALVSVFILFQL